MGSVRDPYIDFARAVSLLLIILAHVGAPRWVMDVRCFEVPLIVFVSGLSFAGRQVQASAAFYVKRTLRLVVPVWLFFGLVYTPLFAVCERLGWVEPGYVSLRRTLSALLMLDGYGYVWIIRVFLLVMLLTPWLIRLERLLRSWPQLLGAIAAVVVGQYALLWGASAISDPSLGALVHALYIFVMDYVAYALGYSVFFLLGLRMRFSSVRAGAVDVVALGTILIGAPMLYMSEGGLPVFDYKYPPRLYFLAYGLCVSALFWVNRRWFASVAALPLFGFVGRNTIWIYLWHIPLVYFCARYVQGWGMRYAIVLSGALAIFYAQYRLSQRLCRPSLRQYLIG